MDEPAFLQLERPASCTVCRHEAMNTHWEFWLSGHESGYLQEAARAAFERVDEVEERLSLYRESSDATRINLAPAGCELRVSDDMIECLSLALEISALTQGAFHVFQGLRSLRAKGQGMPEHLHSLADAASGDLPESPVLALSLEGNLLRKLRAGAILDLGAIGKGFALDMAARTLGEWDVSQACLIAGGSSVLALDPPPEMNAYRLFLPGRPGPFRLFRRAIGASGLGFQGSHIINPRSGESITLHERAYAFSATAGRADALSTASMLLTTDELSGIMDGKNAQDSLLILSASKNLWFACGCPLSEA